MKHLFANRRFLFLFAVLVFFIHNLFSQSKIPDTWQPGMQLTMSYGGGMRYYSYKLFISDTGSYLSVNEEGRVSNYKLRLGQKDLDSLLVFMRAKKFDAIKSEMSGPAHDKGSEHISLHWKDGWASAGESYMMSIAEKDRDRYLDVYWYIHSLADRTRYKIKHTPFNQGSNPEPAGNTKKYSCLWC